MPRPFTDPVWRAALGLVRVLVAWAPGLLILVFGIVYLINCFNVLLAPGNPVRYTYEAAGGEVVVRAESYSIDPWRRTGVLRNVTLTDPTGRQVVSVAKADLAYDHGVIRVKTGDVSANVVRLEDGKFDFESALPKSDEEESTAVVAVEVSRLNVQYEDRTQSPPLRQALLVEGLRADVSKGDVVLTGDLTTDGLPTAPVSAQVDQGGALWIEVTLANSDVLALRPLVGRWLNLDDYPEARDLQARSLRADGKVRFAKDREGKFNIWLNGAVRGEAVTSRPWIENAALNASFTTNADVMRGVIAVREPGRTADFDGELIFGSPFRVAGQVKATAVSRERLWPFLRAEVPADVAFRSATFAGPITYDGRAYVVSGDVTASQLTLWGETVTDVAGQVSLDARQIAANISRAGFAGFLAKGQVRLDTQSQQISGYIETNEGRLEDLAARFDIDDLRGMGQLRATIRGTSRAPEAEILASGNAAWRREDARWLNAGEYEFRGSVRGDVLTVNRLALDGPLGVVSAKGNLNLESRAVDLDIDAGGFELAELNTDLAGLAFLRGELKGTLTDPRLTGRAELFGFSYLDRKIPAASAEVTLTAENIAVSRLEARFGTGVILASGTYAFDSGAIDGKVQSTGLLLQDLVASDVLGRVTVRDGVIEGTLDNPIVTARVTSNELIAFGVDVDYVQASVRATRDQVEVLAGQVRLGQGEVTGTGVYDFSDETVEGKVALKEVPLAKIPGQREGLIYGGTLSGAGSLDRTGVGVWRGEFAGEADHIEVNGTLIGSGSVTATVQDQLVTAQASLGTIERYVNIEESTYDFGTKQLNAFAEVHNFEAEDLTKILSLENAEISDDLSRTIDSVAGAVSFSAKAQGHVDNLAVQLPEFLASKLTINGRDFGEVRLKAERRDKIWTSDQITWKVDETTMTARGTYDESGPIQATVDLANFDLSLLNALSPSIPLLTGKASMTAVASGTQDDPTVRASLSLGNFATVSSGKTVNIPASIEVTEILFEDEVLTAAGQAYYRGFTGDLTARVPLNAFGDEPTGRIEASLVFAERELDAFNEYLTGIDPERSEGKVNGLASLSGPVEDLDISVSIDLEAKQIAFAGQGPTLNDAKIAVRSDAETASIKGEFRSSLGGFGDIDLTARLADILGGEIDLEEFLAESTLSGTVAMDNLRWQTTLPNADRASDVTADGSVTIGGDFEQPRIGGRVELSGVTVAVPSEFPAAGPVREFPINPIFDNLTVVAAPNSTILVSLGRVGLTGSGTINGTLEYPEIRAPLTLESGTFRLPTSRIKLEPGGSINVVYAGDPAVPRVDLAITGTTTVTARQTSENYQTYFVTLDIRGNLLDPDGLRIQGTSDPADLTNAQILALIGQKDLIESLASSAFGSRDGLRDTLFSLAVPSLTMGLTEGIASTLQLDYLTLDYNPFDQGIIRAGKTISNNLMLQVSRQLAEPATGRLKYEVKLTYRLPVKDEFFSKLRLGVGFDQDRPWKFTIDWSRKF